MSDVEAPQNSEDTPVEAPDQGHAETVDVERYKNAQAELTRKSQTLADEELLLRHIAENFPHLIAQEEEQDGEDDTQDFEEDDESESRAVRDPRFDQHVGTLEEMQQLMGAIRFQNDLNEVASGRTFSQEELEFIQARTLQLGNNREALRKAVEQYDGVVNARLDQQTASPKRPRVPHVPSGGQPATGGKNPEDMTSNEKVAHMVERLQSAQG